MWNAIKTGIMTGLEVMSKVPASGIIKAGVFVGVAAFACWVMIKRTKKMHEAAHDDPEQRRSPVDEILGKSYVSDVDAYDDMDPVAKKLCKKLNRGWNGKGKKKKKAQKAKRNVADDRVKVVSVFDEVEEGGERKSRDFTYFTDADAMNQHMHPNKKKKSKKKGKKGVSKKPTSLLDELKTIGYEFKESGITDPKVARDRVDKIAREMGLPVDDFDDDVSEDIRRSCSAIF